jgi:hypothetical protein
MKYLFTLSFIFLFVRASILGWVPDNPKEFCKQHFKSPKKGHDYSFDRDHCFQVITDGQNKKSLKPQNRCAQECIDFSESGDQLANCLNFADCHKNVNRNIKCMNTCKSLAKSDVIMDFAFCIQHCHVYKRACGYTCETKVISTHKKAKDFGICVYKACTSWKEPWIKVCSLVYKDPQDFGACLKAMSFVGRDWNMVCDDPLNQHCPWNKECTKLCKNSGNSKEAIECLKEKCG